jgi:hypothetical protein
VVCNHKTKGIIMKAFMKRCNSRRALLVLTLLVFTIFTISCESKGSKIDQAEIAEQEVVNRLDDSMQRKIKMAGQSSFEDQFKVLKELVGSKELWTIKNQNKRGNGRSPRFKELVILALDNIVTRIEIDKDFWLASDVYEYFHQYVGRLGTYSKGGYGCLSENEFSEYGTRIVSILSESRREMRDGLRLSDIATRYCNSKQIRDSTIEWMFSGDVEIYFDGCKEYYEKYGVKSENPSSRITDISRMMGLANLIHSTEIDSMELKFNRWHHCFISLHPIQDARGDDVNIKLKDNAMSTCLDSMIAHAVNFRNWKSCLVNINSDNEERYDIASQGIYDAVINNSTVNDLDDCQRFITSRYVYDNANISIVQKNELVEYASNYSDDFSQALWAYDKTPSILLKEEMVDKMYSFKRNKFDDWNKIYALTPEEDDFRRNVALEQMVVLADLQYQDVIVAILSSPLGELSDLRTKTACVSRRVRLERSSWYIIKSPHYERR